MREPVQSMMDRIIRILEKAGRNSRKLSRSLDKLEQELRKETGEKQVRWTEEYYLYLLDIYCQAIGPAIEESIAREEYEWAHCLTKRKESITEKLLELS